MLILVMLLIGGGLFAYVTYEKKERALQAEKEKTEHIRQQKEEEAKRNPLDLPPKGVPAQQATTEAELVLNVNDASIVYGDNIDTPLAIASLTKMMTQYLILQKIEEGTVTWETTYRLEEDFLQGYDRTEIAAIGLREAKDYTVRYLFDAMTVASANDAAVALGNLLAGSEEAYTKQMNETAAQLGLQHTHYYNATGLPANGHHNYSTARDLAKLAYTILTEYPDITRYTSQTYVTSEYGEKHYTTNWLLSGMPVAHEGVDGFKTGYTDEAGPTFVATGVQNDQRYVIVLLNAAIEGDDKKTPKFKRAAHLIDFFFPVPHE